MVRLVDGLAVYAALVGTGSLGWTVWHALRNERFHIQVDAGVEGVVVDSDRCELTVAARNVGKTDEAIEYMGIRFFDPTADVMGESSVGQRVEYDLKPNRSARFTVDLASQRFRVGREYQGFITLASGRTVESPWREIDGYLLDLAGVRDHVIKARQGPNLRSPSGPPARSWE
jgi:hypothetical protein